METKEYKIKIPLDKAVTAYLREHDPNNTENGSWKIDVESGLFGAFGTNTRLVKPHFAQSGNYYDPRAKIDEFNIDCYFDQDEIYSQGPDLGDYPSEYTEEELQEAIEYDESIVRSAKFDKVIAEDTDLDGNIIARRIYHIEWI